MATAQPSTGVGPAFLYVKLSEKQKKGVPGGVEPMTSDMRTEWHTAALVINIW
jgi:hypothetical protein